MIDSISDPSLKKNILETIIKNNNSRDNIVIKEAPYQLSEVLHRFQKSKITEKKLK